MPIERSHVRPLPGPDHLVPMQQLKNAAAATGRPRQNSSIRSTHYTSASNGSEWDRLSVPPSRRSDAYGHTFGAGAQDNADVRRRVGNGHAELIRLLGTGPESRHARRTHEQRFDHMGEAATRGNAIHGNLESVWNRGRAATFAVTKGLQGWALSEAMPKRVTLDLSARVEPMAGGAPVKTVPVAALPIPSFGDWPPLTAFVGGLVAKEGFSLAHDLVQPKYFTGIGARRDELGVLAENFRANARLASEFRAGSAGAGIVKAYGEGGRDHLEDTMNEADRSVYDYMKAMQRQTRWAMEPEQHLIETGVDSAATQATLARVAEADFLSRFAGRGKAAQPVVYYWQPPELADVGYMGAATDPLTGHRPAGARARREVSEAECPQRWDYRSDQGALAEVGKALAQIPSWSGYALAQKDLLLARAGNQAALVRLGAMSEDGRLGMAPGAAARLIAQELYDGPARQGNAQAQYRLGLLHAEGGAGGPAGARNDHLAVEWLTKAAEQGHHGAQAELGLMHAAGRTGLDRQRAGREASRWCMKAVQGGRRTPEVLFTLGRMHEEQRTDVGPGDEPSRSAEKWYIEAAKAGHRESCQRLGLLHYSRTPGLKGGAGNNADAAKYLGAAKDLGDAKAAYYLAQMYAGSRAQPEGGIQHMDAARACLEQSADGGYLPALIQLGRLLARGQLEPHGGEPAGQAAARLLLQAARHADADADAQCDLADLYRDGRAQPEDRQSCEAAAVGWYEQAAAQGSARAWQAMASMHEAGQAGIPRGPEANRKMAECLKEAALHGDREIQFQLAEIYREGVPGLEAGAQGDAQAAMWYAMASVRGHVESMYRLGQFYRDGRAQPKGGEPKKDAAVRLLKAAAQEGHAHAGFELGEMLLDNLAGSVDQAADLRKALEHMGAAAAQGDRDLQYRLAARHLQRRLDTPGERQERDGAARVWLEKAARQGHLRALQELAGLHIEGRTGCESQEVADRAAMEYIMTAVDMGDNFSRARLGWMHEMGRAGTASLHESQCEAVTHYTQAVQGDEPPTFAMYQLAVMCIEGRGGIEKGSADSEAVELLRRAAAKDDGISMYVLGMLHAQGRCGLDKDVAPGGKAVYWLTKAAERRVEQAVAYLEGLMAPKAG